eukprot:7603182-Pyramimonas_sp.AAC.1
MHSAFLRPWRLVQAGGRRESRCELRTVQIEELIPRCRLKRLSFVLFPGSSDAVPGEFFAL